MKAVLVAGGAGGIGEGIVRALLASGDARVVVTSRNAERLDGLRERLGDPDTAAFATMVGDAGDFVGAEDIAGRLASLGGIDAVVAVLGRGWWTSGPLLELTAHEWAEVLDEMLTSHFALVRALAPMLASRPGSLYLSIGGGAAFAPMPSAGLVSIAAAGQAMLTRVLHRELGSGPPRIRELVINGPVSTRESRHVAGAGWITDDDVGLVVRDIVLYGATTWPSVDARGPLIVMNEDSASATDPARAERP